MRRRKVAAELDRVTKRKEDVKYCWGGRGHDTELERVRKGKGRGKKVGKGAGY